MSNTTLIKNTDKRYNLTGKILNNYGTSIFEKEGKEQFVTTILIENEQGKKRMLKLWSKGSKESMLPGYMVRVTDMRVTIDNKEGKEYWNYNTTDNSQVICPYSEQKKVTDFTTQAKQELTECKSQNHVTKTIEICFTCNTLRYV